MITIEKEISLTGEELAKEFCNLDCAEQAEFFSVVNNKFAEIGGYGVIQMDYIVEEMDNAGKKFVKNLYEKIIDSTNESTPKLKGHAMTERGIVITFENGEEKLITQQNLIDAYTTIK